jgi:tetratricopeptide (TPR) repeat protein
VHVYIGNAGQGALEELDTECQETICHAIPSVFVGDRAVCLIRTLFNNSISSRLCNVQDKHGNTPLHNAVVSGDVKIVKEYVALCPSAVYIVNSEHATPLDIAMSHKNNEIVDCLLRECVESDPHSTRTIELLQTTLITAMKIGYTHYLNILLQLHSEHGLAIDFECTDCDGHSAWHYLNQKEPALKTASVKMLDAAGFSQSLCSRLLKLLHVDLCAEHSTEAAAPDITSQSPESAKYTHELSRVRGTESNAEVSLKNNVEWERINQTDTAGGCLLSSDLSDSERAKKDVLAVPQIGDTTQSSYVAVTEQPSPEPSSACEQISPACWPEDSVQKVEEIGCVIDPTSPSPLHPPTSPHTDSGDSHVCQPCANLDALCEAEKDTSSSDVDDNIICEPEFFKEENSNDGISEEQASYGDTSLVQSQLNATVLQRPTSCAPPVYFSPYPLSETSLKNASTEESSETEAQRCQITSAAVGNCIVRMQESRNKCIMVTMNLDFNPSVTVYIPGCQPLKYNIDSCELIAWPQVASVVSAMLFNLLLSLAKDIDSCQFSLIVKSRKTIGNQVCNYICMPSNSATEPKTDVRGLCKQKPETETRIEIGASQDTGSSQHDIGEDIQNANVAASNAEPPEQTDTCTDGLGLCFSLTLDLPCDPIPNTQEVISIMEEENPEPCYDPEQISELPLFIQPPPLAVTVSDNTSPAQENNSCASKPELLERFKLEPNSHCESASFSSSKTSTNSSTDSQGCTSAKDTQQSDLSSSELPLRQKHSASGNRQRAESRILKNRCSSSESSESDNKEQSNDPTRGKKKYAKGGASAPPSKSATLKPLIQSQEKKQCVNDSEIDGAGTPVHAATYSPSVDGSTKLCTSNITNSQPTDDTEVDGFTTPPTETPPTDTPPSILYDSAKPSAAETAATNSPPCREEESSGVSVLEFTNSSNPLDVIHSHMKVYSKCCPRHDIRNVVTIGTTYPPSDAFGPKRRYSSIKDIHSDPSHSEFDYTKKLSAQSISNRHYRDSESQQIMFERPSPESVLRQNRGALPPKLHSPSLVQSLMETTESHPSPPLSSRQQTSQLHHPTENLAQGRSKNSEAAVVTVANREASAENPESTRRLENARSSIQSRHSFLDSETVPRDHKERIRGTAELLHAQDYNRILPIAYEGDPPHSLPPLLKIPFVFITGLAYYKLSSHKKSVQFFTQCLALADDCGRDGDITICNIYIGDIDFAKRRYSEAAGRYQTALQHYSRESVAQDFRMVMPTRSAVWLKCGSAFKNASRVGDSVAAYEKAIELAASKKDQLSAHTSLGNLYQGIGENGRAVKEYEAAIELAQDLEDNVSLGWNHGNLGNALLGLHQRDKALHHLFKALDMAVEFETTPQAIGRAYNNLGTAFQSLNELAKAEEHYDLALAQAIYGNDIPGQARVYGNIGNLQMLNKQFDRAVPHYTEVMRLSQDKSTITTAHHNRGCAYYDWAEKKKKDYAQRSTTNESAESSKTTTFKVSLHGPNFERCEEDYRPPFVSDGIQKYYLQGTRDLEYVMRHHEENFNGIKGSPKGLSLSVSLFETNSRTFHRMQDCLVHVKKSDHQPSKFEDALLVAEQSRARTLGELLLKRRGPQLENKLESLPSLPQLKSIVERQHHPVLYLSYTGERLLGWLLVPEFEGEELKGECTLNMFEVPLSDSEFDGKSFDYHLRYSLNEQLVERSFEMYKPFKHDKDNPDPVAKLHDLVAKPVIHMLKTLKKQQSSQEKGQKSSNSEEEKRRKVEPQKIIVIPDSYTNLLPFTCTLDRDSGKFWGDDYYFQIMPSLLTMGILDQLPKVSVAIPVEHQQMLCVVGNPTIPPFKYNNDEWNLGKLPHATKEAEWVSHILKCKPILHEQATKDAVMMRIMNAKVIHLATHGSAVAGFLAFAGMTASTTDTVDAKRVLIYPEEIESLNISPALVVLSSCDSGRGVFKADGIQGMARAFILAGAQAVLTTLWRVPDESACIFMQFFYQYLVEGVKGPEALHKSILSLRCFKKYSQYIHWSGYQLTGREFQFQVNQSSARAQLTTRLGQSSIFPQLDILKSLETAFMNNPRLPTDVQVLHGPPGVKPSEPMIDFIHCHHTHFTGGIFWINCRTPQLIDASIEYIKDAMKVKNLSDLPDNESQPSLVVLDSLDQFPTECGPLLTFLKRVTVHIVIISKNVAAPDQLRKSIDRQLIRGTNTIDVQPLSTIHATQRLVHSALKNHHLAPSPKYQKVFEQLAEFTTGSPPILDLASSLLDQSLRQTEHATEDYDALENFEKQVQLDQLPKLKPLSVPKDDRHTSLSLPQPACVRNIIPEVFESIKMSDDDDVWNTSAKYDSWQVTTVLIRQCNLTPEEQLLLFCLSNFSCSPIPTAYVTEIATIITKASHQPHLASTLHTKLEDAKMLKVYPKPAVYHPTLQTHTSGSASAAAEAEFVYVPRFISAAVWKDMMTDMDKVMALGTCYKALHNIVDQSHTDNEKSFLLGIGSLLVESYELNFKLVGKLCFQEVYSLFLSSHRSL